MTTRILIALLALAPLAACTDEHFLGTLRDAADDEATDGTDGGGGTLTVFVVADDLSLNGALSPRPLAGATVAVDPPGGARIEKTTDASGRAEFTGIDWSAGTADAIAHLDGWDVMGRVGITAADGEVMLVLDELGPPSGLVEVAGTVRNLDPIGCLAVTATVPCRDSWGCIPGSGYSLQVTPDTPFTIVALGFVPADVDVSRETDWPMIGMLLLDHPGVSEPTTVDLDFAEPATPTRVSGTFALPSSPDSFLAYWGTGVVTVRSRRTAMFLGRSVRSRPSADERSVEYDVEFLEPAGVDDPVTAYEIWMPMGTPWAASSVLVDGYPTPGAHAPEFLEAPGITSPRPTVHEPITWELYDEGGTTIVGIFREDPLQQLIAVLAPAGATAVTIPPLPSTADEDALLGTDPLVGLVGVIQPDPADGRIERQALSEFFEISR